jgi:hypothetical protein
MLCFEAVDARPPPPPPPLMMDACARMRLCHLADDGAHGGGRLGVQIALAYCKNNHEPQLASMLTMFSKVPPPALFATHQIHDQNFN